ncbi:MAG: glucokinase [Gaiellales bacterium]|nr:glucokinase [Gaiellales bacterium]
MLATPMTDSFRPPVVGVDLGGTTIKAALVSGDLEILARNAVRTDLTSQAGLLEQLVRLVRSVSDGAALAGVGFGLPSLIDQRRGVVLDSTNIPLENLDFAREMSSRLGVPVAVDNDANVACLAEARSGAARGASHVVMLTLGTGVGGGLLLNGRLYRGSIGAGAELGHMSIDEDGPPCQGTCPSRGCLEVLVSATGVRAAAERVALERPEGSLGSARARGEGFEARWVMEQAQNGDPDAIRVYEIVGGHLGVGLANFSNIFNPELFVIGGGVAAAGDLLLGPARAVYRRRALPGAGVARVVPAERGNDAGVLGAAAMVLEELVAAPA